MSLPIRTILLVIHHVLSEVKLMKKDLYHSTDVDKVRYLTNKTIELINMELKQSFSVAAKSEEWVCFLIFAFK